MKAKLFHKARLATLGILTLSGATMFGSCGINQIRDNLVAGAMAGIEGAAQNWVDGVLINFNEWFEATPDNPIDTP